MNVQLPIHLMPWEIDQAFLFFDRLKRSLYYINRNDSIILDVCLNLSSYIIK